MIGSVSLYDDDDDGKCVEVVRALDSRCQVPQVATVHGRMPPLYIYWCRIASCMIQAVSSFCLLFFLPFLYIGVVEPPVLLSIDVPPLYILVSECAVFKPSLFVYMLVPYCFLYPLLFIDMPCLYLVKLTGERQRRKKSTVFKTSTRNLTSLGKFKLVN